MERPTNPSRPGSGSRSRRTPEPASAVIGKTGARTRADAARIATRRELAWQSERAATRVDTDNEEAQAEVADWEDTLDDGLG